MYNLLLTISYIAVSVVRCDIFNVEIDTEHHVNVVDRRFLSFTIDPKYLFSSSKKYNNKESICMASSLTPALIRIAGPSTSDMTFHNDTITLNDIEQGHQPQGQLTVTHGQWRRFTKWAQKTGFDLVFALNNEQKTEAGLWDTDSAVNILSVADKAKVEDIFWQLGYECHNQSIEDYISDLETLRAMTETVPSERRSWRVVGGDVTRCLGESRSDFKDYLALSDELMDAVFLNGNSSARELERMSEPDRIKLLKLLSTSNTPLWITETPHFTDALQLRDKQEQYSDKEQNILEKLRRRSDKTQNVADKKGRTEESQSVELLRAADWMSSLGYSAKNGFSVHFRELMEEELYEPTLSFYMALLFKNLVGERVLNVDLDASESVLFAHCTSLRQKPIAGTVTLFGANLDDEPARFSVKLARLGEGDVLQFILGYDISGNIIVNGRPMYYEGDIRPVVKRIRPFKSLLINLPPRSFGFWVIANTDIQACRNVTDTDKNQTDSDDNELTNYEISTKTKRINIDFNESSEIGDTGENENIKVEEKNNETAIYEVDKEDDSARGDISTGKSNESNSTEDYEDTSDVPNVKVKRSMKIRKTDIEEDEDYADENETLEKENGRLGHKLSNLLQTKLKKRSHGKRVKRQAFIDVKEIPERKLRRQVLKQKLNKINIDDDKDNKQRFEFLRKILSLNGRLNLTKLLRHDRTRKVHTFSKNRVNKRNSGHYKVRSAIEDEVSDSVDDEILKKSEQILNRKRRNVINEKSSHAMNVKEYNSEENNINFDREDQKKLWKILQDIHEQLRRLPTDDESRNEDDEDEIPSKPKHIYDTKPINYSQKSSNGLLKSTISNVLTVLSDLNKNLNKFWGAIDILE